jgi:hypothetical protein
MQLHHNRSLGGQDFVERAEFFGTAYEAAGYPAIQKIAQS